VGEPLKVIDTVEVDEDLADRCIADMFGQSGAAGVRLLRERAQEILLLLARTSSTGLRPVGRGRRKPTGLAPRIL
jgi:hypothetical protein